MSVWFRLRSESRLQRVDQEEPVAQLSPLKFILVWNGVRSYLTWPRPFPSHCKQGVNKRRKDESTGSSVQTLLHVTVRGMNAEPAVFRRDGSEMESPPPHVSHRLGRGVTHPGCAHPFTLCDHSHVLSPIHGRKTNHRKKHNQDKRDTLQS